MEGWSRPHRKPWFTKRQLRKRSPRCYTWTQTKYGWMRKSEWRTIAEAETAIREAQWLAFCQALEKTIAAKIATFTGCDGENLTKKERRTRTRAAVGKLRRFASKNGYPFGEDLYYQIMCKKNMADCLFDWRYADPDKYKEAMDREDVLEKALQKAAEDNISQRQKKRASDMRARKKANRTKTRLRNRDRDFKTSCIF